jgi:hypothetical protein
MSDLPPHPDANGDSGAGSDRGLTASTPRWVYVFGIIAIILILLFVILHLAGGGPGGHIPS